MNHTSPSRHPNLGKALLKLLLQHRLRGIAAITKSPDHQQYHVYNLLEKEVAYVSVQRRNGAYEATLGPFCGRNSQEYEKWRRLNCHRKIDLILELQIPNQGMIRSHAVNSVEGDLILPRILLKGLDTKELLPLEANTRCMQEPEIEECDIDFSNTRGTGALYYTDAKGIILEVTMIPSLRKRIKIKRPKISYREPVKYHIIFIDNQGICHISREGYVVSASRGKKRAICEPLWNLSV